MKRRKMAVGISIACLFIVIAIQAVLGGGMGLSINPKDVENTTPGSTITYGITVYNYYSSTESFYISVDSGSCDYDWFGWHTTSISIPGRGQGQVSLDVTPTMAGNYSFTVSAISTRDPGAQAIQMARINVIKPPLVIVSSHPPHSVIDCEGEAGTFNITINQIANVSWLINGTEVSTNTSVIEASYTNTSAAIGTWNVSAIVSNPNGADMEDWEWTVKPKPKIVFYAPPSPVSDIENATRTFNITIDQIANVSWLINGTEVSTNTSVIEASYTNTSAAIGTWNVSAIASNPCGTDMQEWMWTVVKPILKIVSYAPPSPVSDIENTTRKFNITIDQIANVSWLINGTEVSTNTSVIEASYTNASAVIGTWNVSAIASNLNGTDMQKWDWNVTPPLPPTQFMIYGWVFYENGSACNNPIVNITNLNVSLMWPHLEKIDNYYELNLTPGIDINESEVLLFDVKSPDALPSNITIHWVTKDDINVSGLFPFNMTLNYPPTCIAVMPNPSYQPQINGTNITWKACAFDPEGDGLWFRFWLDGPRTGGIGNPTIVQNWSKSNVWIWETNGSDVGDNLIYADVRDCHHANNFTVPEYDLYERMWYWIT